MEIEGERERGREGGREGGSRWEGKVKNGKEQKNLQQGETEKVNIKIRSVYDKSYQEDEQPCSRNAHLRVD